MINQQTVPDPVNDRDEFKRRLKTMICWTNEFSTKEVIEALLSNDSEKIQEINSRKSWCQSQVDDYLEEWDNAEDENARRIICGKPKKNRPNR